MARTKTSLLNSAPTAMRGLSKQPAALGRGRRVKLQRQLYQAPAVASASTKKSRKTVVKAVVGKAKTATGRVRQGRVIKPKAAATLKKVKEPRKKGNDLLTPRPTIKVLSKDPLFETREKIPLGSVSYYSKLPIRAALLGDSAMMRQLIADKANVTDISCVRSPVDTSDALTYAVKNHDFPTLNLILQFNNNELKDKKYKGERIGESVTLLRKANTGQSNFHMLGRHTRAVQMTRGGKEGVNALLKDGLRRFYQRTVNMNDLIQSNPSPAFLKQLNSCKPRRLELALFGIGRNVITAVRQGNRSLALFLMEQAQIKQDFNELHRGVLRAKDAAALPNFLPVSVKKKAQMNNWLTPMHCAAINPNEQVLQKLVAVDPDVNTPDRSNWRPVHYAAVCEGDGPLRLLVGKGVSLTDTNKEGLTPLDLAVETDRPDNVRLLIDEQKRQNAAGWNQRSQRTGLAPVHRACKHGHTRALDVLIEKGVDLELTASASHNKLTPLMFAAQHGHMAMVKTLVAKGCLVNARDKLKRTPLLLATLAGETPMVSYLLHIGADAELADSSGNAPVHYAAAYGWIHCMQLLVAAGADMNPANDWQLCPLAVAYLKAHMHIVDYLLNSAAGVDIDASDVSGLTLLMYTVKDNINAGTLKQVALLRQIADVKILLDDYKASADKQDAQGNTVLHHLASIAKPTEEPEKADKWQMNVASHLIWRARVNVDTVNEQGRTAAELAIKAGHLRLAVELLKTQKVLNKDQDVVLDMAGYGANLLHDLVHPNLPDGLDILTTDRLQLDARGWQHVDTSDAAVACFKTIAKLNPKLTLQYLRATNTYGMSPCTYAVHLYAKYANLPDKHEDLTEAMLGDALAQKRALIMTMIGFQQAHDPNRLQADQVLEVDKTTEQDDNASEAEESDEEESDDDDDNDEGGKQKKANTDAQPDLDDTVVSCVIDSKLNLMRPCVGQTTVHLAVRQNAHELAKGENRLLDTLLEMGAYGWALAARDAHGYTPFTLAVDTQNTSAAIKLLKSGQLVRGADLLRVRMPHVRYVSNVARGTDGGTTATDGQRQALDETALMRATQLDMHEVAREILVHAVATTGTERSDITKISDSNGDTALHYAARHSSAQMADIVDTLVTAKLADAGVENNRRRLPIHVACMANTGSTDDSIECVEKLISLNRESLLSRDQLGRTPLHYVFIKDGEPNSSDHIDPVPLCALICNRVPAASICTADETGNTPLHYAARRGANICIMRMLDQINAGLNAPRANQPLHFDTKNKIKGVADITSTVQGNTPFGIATLHEHESAALTFLQAGACLLNEIVLSDSKYSTLESWARANKWNMWIDTPPKPKLKRVSVARQIVANDWQGVLFMLLDKIADDWSGLCQLIEAAFLHQKYNLACSLLRMLKNRLPGTGIIQPFDLMHHFAVNCAPTCEKLVQEKVLNALIDVGYPISTPSKDKRRIDCPVLIDALRKHNMTLYELIVDRLGVNKLKLIECDSTGHTTFSALFESADLTDLDEEKWKKVMLQLEPQWNSQAIAPYPTLYECLSTEGVLKHHDDIDVSNSTATKHSSTPLMQAIIGRRFELAKFLLNEIKADVSELSSDGFCAMAHAVKTNQVDMVRLLLNHDYMPMKKTATKTTKAKKVARRQFHGARIVNTDKNDDDDDDEDDEDIRMNEENSGNEDEVEAEEAEEDEDEEGSGEDNDDSESVAEDNEEQDHDDDDDDDDDESEVAPPATKKVRRSKMFFTGQPTLAFPPATSLPMFGSTTIYSPAKSPAAKMPAASPAKSPAKSSTAGPARSPAADGGAGDKEVPINKMTGRLIQTSDVNLKWTDSTGRGLIAYGMWVTSAGGWAQAEILQLLSENGAPAADGELYSGIDRTTRRHITAERTFGPWPVKVPCPKPPPPVVRRSSSAGSFKVAPAQHAAEFVAAHDARAKQVAAAKTAAGQPDAVRPHKHSDMQLTGEIVKCPTTGDPCAVLLNKCDLNHGLYGYYNFYRLQLIKRKSAELYVVFTNWGRIGDEGQYQRTPFDNMADAMKEFAKIYLQKTGNQWANHRQFAPLPKKYAPVKVVRLAMRNVFFFDPAQQTAADKQNKMAIDLKCPRDRRPTFVDKGVQRLIGAIIDPLFLQDKQAKLRINDYRFRVQQLLQPFGKLDTEVLGQARKLLQDILKKYHELEKERRKKADNQAEAQERVLKVMAEQMQMSEQFWQLMPIGGFEDCMLPVLDNQHIVHQIIKYLNDLLQIESASEVVMAAAQMKQTVHPIDYVYKALDSTIEPLTPRDDTSRWILQYVHNTYPQAKIQSIYQYNRTQNANKELDVLRGYGNRRLLWHGTKAQNLLSILRQGLLVAPISANPTGYLYGQGIYTADNFEKSTHYCQPSSDGTKYMLLCDVALGDVKVLKTDDRIEDHSRQLGKRNSVHAPVRLPEGAIVPLGNQVENPSLKQHRWAMYDLSEFVVYKAEQVVIRYIVAYK